jgi:hypothetical protein
MKNKSLITSKKKVIRKSPAENEFLMIEITEILINSNYYFFLLNQLMRKRVIFVILRTFSSARTEYQNTTSVPFRTSQ